MIGIQYLVTTIVFFVIAGLLAMFMRAELARPGMQFVDNQTFNGLFSVHAALMIFLFVIPAFAGIGNYVIPLMIGAPDMAFPRLNALSFWLLIKADDEHAQESGDGDLLEAKPRSVKTGRTVEDVADERREDPAQGRGQTPRRNALDQNRRSAAEGSDPIGATRPTPT